MVEQYGLFGYRMRFSAASSRPCAIRNRSWFLSKPEKTYYEPIKPLDPKDQKTPHLSAQHEQDDLLDIQDVLGKKIISTRLRRNVTIREENGNAALEIISRFAVNPKWLIYLPPTMSPGETSEEPGLLEHPRETFQYFKSNGVEKVICEEKHMGSRAVVVLCKDETTASKRFGVLNEGIGACYTRTGRPFFKSEDLEQEVLTRISRAVKKNGIMGPVANRLDVPGLRNHALVFKSHRAVTPSIRCGRNRCPTLDSGNTELFETIEYSTSRSHSLAKSV